MAWQSGMNWGRRQRRKGCIHFPFSSTVWNSVLDQFVVQWVIPSSFVQLCYAGTLSRFVLSFSLCGALFLLPLSLAYGGNVIIGYSKDLAEPNQSVSRRVFAKCTSWASSSLRNSRMFLRTFCDPRKNALILHKSLF